MAVERLNDTIGPATIEVKKSQISFGTNTKFAWVWLLQSLVNKRPENGIVLTFVVDHYIENDQIVEVREPYPGRWIHHLIIQNEDDLNEEVKQWLAEAYTFSEQRRKK